jgi:hypothetical protein
MPAAQYNILADQGSTFKLFVDYQTAGATAVNLNNHRAEMQVRRNSNNSGILLYLTGSGFTATAVTGGGETGFFTPGTIGSSLDGIQGTGGIRLNTSYTGGSGSNTGGIYINVDALSMSNVPVGRHLYDLELINGSEVTRILQGRFEIEPEITK